MNILAIYTFTITASSPLRFGSSEAGELVTNAKGEPILLGNAIGGAIRDYLSLTNMDDNMIITYFGGECLKETVDEENQKRETLQFCPSKVYISDAEITPPADYSYDKYIKEGTQINAAYGSAQHHHKYSIAYLPKGTKLSFTIECDLDLNQDEQKKETKQRQMEIKQKEEELQKIISTLAHGLKRQKLRLGGQQNNGFGQFEEIVVEQSLFTFDSIEALDHYIFAREDVTPIPFDYQSKSGYEIAERTSLQLSMEGYFPYGVYQHDRMQSHQKDEYFIPASSLKGLIRNEVMLLLNRVIGDKELATKKCEELFGSTGQKGKVMVYDLLLTDVCEVKIARIEKDKDKDPYKPKYNKIDRLTGGVVSTALKDQEEIQGKATIQLQLTADNKSPYLFPLLYVLRRIGTGFVPLGGRTVIGLGLFEASEVQVYENGHSHTVTTTDNLSPESKNKLTSYYEEFQRWCNSED